MSSRSDTGTKVGIVGLGYVGLPLAIEFCKAGFLVVGVDKNEEKVEKLQEGKTEITDIDPSALAQFIADGRLEIGTSYDELARVDLISVCVPTPLRKSRSPDMSFVIEAGEKLSEVLVPGQTVVFESTVYPGATENLILPSLEESGLELDKDFYLAFSPERIDPGNEEYGINEIPKVVGGVTKDSTEKVVGVYEEVFDEVFPVESAIEAELAKLLENTYRAVNIGLINELAQVAEQMDADIWNVIDAASTKPFGYEPFYPGPGLGGHCIPVDPLFLSWASKLNGTPSKFIELADEINRGMPDYVVERIVEILNVEGKALSNSNVLLIGIAYKANVGDTRESPGLKIIKLLKDKGATVEYSDPFVDEIEMEGETKYSTAISASNLGKQDLVVIVTDHDEVDYQKVVENSKLLFDTRNATSDFGSLDKIYRL